ncbi:MAG TPA: apolipoprotein N-acyltransferase [Candidatus Kapabacteria bacterium]|nr:apolipoprotein N-acyltransferase [Candidatus Kapabacteria bacterium]
MAQKSWRNRFLAILSGLLLVVSFPPFGLIGGFCAFIALVPLLIALENSTRLRDAFGIGYLAMFVCSLGATYWVGGFKGEGSVDPFLMAGGVALAIIHPLFLILPILTYDAMRRRFSRITALIALPVIWIGFEYWHSTGDLSFPWLNLYNTQTYNTAYIQFIEFTGSFGLSLIILAINILLYCIIRYSILTGKVVGVATGITGVKKAVRLKLLFIVVSLIVLPYVYGFSVLNSPASSSSTLKVTIVQPNINPWDKWSTGTEQITDSMFRSTRTAIRTAGVHSDLILWPETAITYPITLPWRKGDLQKVYDFINEIGTPILTGIPDREEYLIGRDQIPDDAKKTKDYTLFYRDWNSSMMFYADLSGKPTYQRYHKQKLVPFGEHVPFVDWFPILGDWFSWGVGLGSWNVGRDYDAFKLPLHRGLMKPDTAKLCTMICYESVYPAYVRKFVANGAQVIGIITNDGWYGKSSGPFQHNRYAILRSIENRRWVIRSANTGISSVIDDRGRIVTERPLFESASITTAIPLLDEQTLYTKLGDFIAVPFEWATGGLIILLFIGRFKKKKEADAS